MKIFKTLLLSAAIWMMAALTNDVQAQSFTIVNYSDWTIYEIYFSPTWDSQWSEDKLGYDVLEPNYQYRMALDYGCGDYDVKIVDEDDDVCVVNDVYLCNDTWEIYSDDLLECMGY